jgi:hypothetical protein
MGNIDRLPASGTDWHARNLLARDQATVGGYRGPVPAACPEHGEG